MACRPGPERWPAVLVTDRGTSKEINTNKKRLPSASLSLPEKEVANIKRVRAKMNL